MVLGQIVPTEPRPGELRALRCTSIAYRLTGRRPGGLLDRGGRDRHGVPARRRVLRDLRRRDHAPRLPAGRAPARGRLPSVDARGHPGGAGYVRSHTWLWGTILWSLIAFPFTTAPYVVLLPYPKHDLGGDAGDLGPARGRRSGRPGDRAAACADHDPAAPRDVHVLAVRVRRHRPPLLRPDERAVAGDGDRGDRRGGTDRRRSRLEHAAPTGGAERPPGTGAERRVARRLRAHAGRRPSWTSLPTSSACERPWQRAASSGWC